MPPFLTVIRSCDRNMREYLFKQLAQLVSIIKQHARNYLADIFAIIKVWEGVRVWGCEGVGVTV